MAFPQGGPRQPEFDLEQILGRIKDALGPIGQKLGSGGIGLLITGVVALILVIWLATGVYTISPGEQAALRLFGEVREAPVSETGLHWWWPGSSDQGDWLRRGCS